MSPFHAIGKSREAGVPPGRTKSRIKVPSLWTPTQTLTYTSLLFFAQPFEHFWGKIHQAEMTVMEIKTARKILNFSKITNYLLIFSSQIGDSLNGCRELISMF
jgi:hypothetical protein